MFNILLAIFLPKKNTQLAILHMFLVLIQDFFLYFT